MAKLPIPALVQAARTLRVAEKVILFYLGGVALGAILFPLPLRERATLLGLNLVTGAVLVSLAAFGNSERSKLLASLRDWLPCFLILLAYRESGMFFRPDPAHRLDYVFVRLDDVLLKNSWAGSFLEASAPWFQRYLELAYLLCYPLVPLGLASLYLARPGRNLRVNPTGDAPGRAGGEWARAMDHFWTAVLLAALACYALYPFFPLTPPRELFHDLPGPAVAPLFRRTNFWILGQYGVGASLFPSGHVAATTALALALHRFSPRLGAIFLIAAGSIALATVYGRYHYAADALAGLLVGGIAAYIAQRIHSAPRR